MQLGVNLDYESDGAGVAGTPRSHFLKTVVGRGFNPIGITLLMGDEAIIFETETEANAARDAFSPKGWWYGVSGWAETRKVYVEVIYGGDESAAPRVYWLNGNDALG